MAVPRTGLILAIDQGTTNTKVLAVEASTGRVVVSGASRVPIAYPRPGWVEQSAEAIWNSVLEAMSDVLTGIDVSQVIGISVSSQRESVVAWDGRDGRALGPVLGWQDARTAADCERLVDMAARVRQLSGLTLDPMYSAPKIRWLLDTIGDVPALRIGTVDTFLVHRLTGEYLAEAGNASRTMLMDLDSLSWSDELADIFGVATTVLAPVQPSHAVYGCTIAQGPLPAGIPVVAVMADSHSALYLHTDGRAGEGKATYGTGSSIMVNADRGSDGTTGIATTLAWQTDEPTYAREGNILASGAALTWAAQLLTDGDVAALGDLASSISRTDVVLVPAFSGLAAPHFDREAAGLLSGLTADVRAADVARAAFDAVAHQVSDVVEAIDADSDAPFQVLHADGGASASALLMQRQADLLNRPIHVADVPEASALGAAKLAGRTLGMTSDGESWERRSTLIEPRTDPEMRQLDRAQWHHAIARSRLRRKRP